MRRRRRRRNPNNTLLYVLGGAAVLGVGYLLLSKSGPAAVAAGTTPGNISITTGQTNPLLALAGAAGNTFKGLFGGSSGNGNNNNPANAWDPTTDPNYDPTSVAGDPSATDSNTTDFIDTTSTGA
jgi:hypothetical protein